MWKIENTDELSNFIQTLKTCDQIDFEKIELNFIKKIKIKIQGDPLRYNGSINYAICKMKFGVPMLKLKLASHILLN